MEDIKTILNSIFTQSVPSGRGGGENLHSTRNKQGCAILTCRVLPKNLGTYQSRDPKIQESEMQGVSS